MKGMRDLRSGPLGPLLQEQVQILGSGARAIASHRSPSCLKQKEGWPWLLQCKGPCKGHGQNEQDPEEPNTEKKASGFSLGNNPPCSPPALALVQREEHYKLKAEDVVGHGHRISPTLQFGDGHMLWGWRDTGEVIFLLVARFSIPSEEQPGFQQISGASRGPRHRLWV